MQNVVTQLSMYISTHAPRTGSDNFARRMSEHLTISTHAPRTGSDATVRRATGCNCRFQPTLPARGATGVSFSSATDWAFQPTLPARGATWRCWMREPTPEISTHAPRTGSDACGLGAGISGGISTHAPRTGSDRTLTELEQCTSISTHAPRTGSDCIGCPMARAETHFNPRSPHGERHQSERLQLLGQLISTHAPRTGSDYTLGEWLAVWLISTHAPRTGSDTAPVTMFDVHYSISTHAPRTGSDTMAVRATGYSCRFQPTLPARGATRL